MVNGLLLGELLGYVGAVFCWGSSSDPACCWICYIALGKCGNEVLGPGGIPLLSWLTQVLSLELLTEGDVMVQAIAVKTFLAIGLAAVLGMGVAALGAFEVAVESILMDERSQCRFHCQGG